jgi:diaminohydroxyphosphoribosylaminopyrimidine deaminase / 5-amino-6-(5-phosphoribosylamino)uracil reductase
MPNQNDEYWILRTLELAQRAKGHTSPNPMVGAIVLDAQGNLIAEGYHEKAGSPHAEVIALRKAGEKAKGGTLYINLEPCSHYGRTPPCTKAIMEHRLKKVVIGTPDPNPKINGQGIKFLQNFGIEVKTNVLADECLKVNKFFFQWIKTNKPWLTLKIAASLDGKIGYSDELKWITGLEARTKVHEFRTEYDALLTGSGTIIADNPRLTARLVNGRNPIRIILDRRLRSTPTHKIFREPGQNILFTSHKKAESMNFRNTEIVQWNGHLEEVLLNLGKRNIISVLVEAGTELSSAFLQSKLVNEVLYFMRPSLLGNSNNPVVYLGEEQNFCIEEIKRYGQDLLLEMLPI